LGNTPYQQDSVLVTYATNPDRALTLLDSALFLGNISDYRGRFIRARIYSKSLMQQQQDSAIQICKALLTHDSVRNAPVEQENIYDMLIAASRVKHDLVAYLHWATKKAELCQQQGEETERWRTEADIGYLMTRLGQVDEGLCKLDEVIGHLDAPGSIDRMDAFVVAVKRKINALNDLHRFKEVILLAQRILDRLDHYEQHANDYAEDSYRLSWSNNPNDRDRYLDFSRAQAWGFLAQAYSLISEELRVKSEELAAAQKAREYLVLFDQSDYGKTFMARRMIAPTQMALGMYDEALATYDEVQRRMDGDTLNDDYAVILRSRATAAYAQATTNSQFSTLNSQLKSAYDYQTRYATLSKAVSDSLHRSEAHDYAARYHAAEQEWEIQRKEAQIERSLIINIALGIGFLFVLMAAIYVYRQKRIVSQKNHALVRMINEQMDDASTPPVTEVPLALRRGGRGEGPLFSSIDAAIRGERLYKNVNLQRQDICERFSINRHALNELLTEYADGLSFPQYINSIRIQEALRLLHDEPTKTVSAIAAEVGFTSANLREQFKRKYGVTPAEYRQNQ
jgi:AraC-like DNA-binding protein